MNKEYIYTTFKYFVIVLAAWFGYDFYRKRKAKRNVRNLENYVYVILLKEYFIY
jgi:hypothetical protein